MQSYAALLARSSAILRSFPIPIVIGWITVRSAKPIVLCGLTASTHVPRWTSRLTTRSTALGAVLIPARRASAVNPTDALRFE